MDAGLYGLVAIIDSPAVIIDSLAGIIDSPLIAADAGSVRAIISAGPGAIK